MRGRFCARGEFLLALRLEEVTQWWFVQSDRMRPVQIFRSFRCYCRRSVGHSGSARFLSDGLVAVVMAVIARIGHTVGIFAVPARAFNVWRLGGTANGTRVAQLPLRKIRPFAKALATIAGSFAIPHADCHCGYHRRFRCLFHKLLSVAQQNVVAKREEADGSDYGFKPTNLATAGLS